MSALFLLTNEKKEKIDLDYTAPIVTLEASQDTRANQMTRLQRDK